MLKVRDFKAEGVPSAVSSAIEDLNAAGIPMHSLLVAKNSELAAEAYWKPYSRDTLHRMYSCTKSFVSLAIGTLIGEGKLRLDDHITDYFPEMLPREVPEELAALTIRNMLMMRSCYSKTTYKEGGRQNYIPSWQKDWIRSFFTAKPDHDPGMFFIYDTSSTHTLASLAQKLAGRDLLSFMKETFLSGLGISDDAYIVRDPMGNPSGGSGLMLRPIDLLKVIDGIMHKTLPAVPGWYIDEAVSRLSETEIAGRDADLKAGYGYQFWRLSHDSFCMYGLGGQYAVAIPSEDMAIVTTADTQADKSMDKTIFSAIWKIAENLGTSETAAIPELSIPVSKGKDSEKGRKLFAGRSFVFPEGNKAGISRISFSFGDEGTMTIERPDGTYAFRFGFGRNIKNEFPVKQSSPCYASGGFLSDTLLAVLVQFGGEELGSIKIQAGIKDRKISIMMHLHGELSVDGFEGIVKGVEA